MSPSFQALIKRCTAIAVLKDAQRFEYRNTKYNDTWIFWLSSGIVVASAITHEFGATLCINRDDGPTLNYNDGQAWNLIHLGTLAGKSEGEDSGTWALGLTNLTAPDPVVSDETTAQLDSMYKGYAEP